jgi:hypothetical protein
MLKFLPILCVLTLLVSCDSNRTQKEIYWNSISYFQSETTRLTAERIGLHKKLLFDHKDQTTELLTPDWKKELEPFLAIDLQKVSYQGRFDVDTITVGDTAYRIHYQATEEQTDLQNCTVVCDKQNGSIISFSAKFNHLNNLYQSTKTYTYSPLQGYSIKGDQQVKLVNPVDYEIEGNFVSPE